MALKQTNLKLKNVSVSDESSDNEEEKTELSLDISLEKLNLGPKKKLLVIALGGLLVHRQHDREKFTKIPPNIRPDVFHGRFRVYKRPFCDDFLKFCFERFEVGLWSAAREHNIQVLLNTLLGAYRNRLLFVWDQEDCTDTEFMCLDNKYKPIFLKELDKVWEKHGQYSSSNTMLIDDEPYRALLNPPNTAIFTKKYIVGDVKDNLLGPKGELQSFLDGLAEAANVPSYVKDNPFGQPAITPSHSDWLYYSKIVRKLSKGVPSQKQGLRF
ncbi:FCP1 homology domain-containing protein [Heracleum sosnowskyi]|uniref:Mitochondrial import inner membrane translocase subunit TIM50 n=1 Tax=Heracleum sosnowskyi TaxID=360622 RepID=A0AAD8H9V4_9APIA|nr:FCP1 homology domain-containing protein [Heracleum sosnowskyi]KAK1362177.1 FCP1 homology domain-containing protein [Heracleum sosnowskyi]